MVFESISNLWTSCRSQSIKAARLEDFGLRSPKPVTVLSVWQRESLSCLSSTPMCPSIAPSRCCHQSTVPRAGVTGTRAAVNAELASLRCRQALQAQNWKDLWHAAYYLAASSHNRWPVTIWSAMVRRQARSGLGLLLLPC